MKYIVALLLALLAACSPPPRSVSGPPVLVLSEADVGRPTATRVEKVVATRRPLRPLRAMPPEARSPRDVAVEQRVAAIALALERARTHEEWARWDECAKEGGDKLGVATELLASTNRLEMLRDLHLQIGACLSLGPEPANAQPHFRIATLLDESPPPAGAHREEAEKALATARSEVIARRKGPVRIETDPPGAEVWIDGRRLRAVTPVTAEVRLGEHFVTLRRFRFEPQINHALLQPATSVRFVLQPAQRDTLGRQLAEVRAGKRRPPPRELSLAKAAWSDAHELVEIAESKGKVRLDLVSVDSGRSLRRATVAPGADDDELRATVCATLGESCEPEARGIPWYVWPIAGLALVGGSIAIGFAADSQRGTVFCPPNGC